MLFIFDRTDGWPTSTLLQPCEVVTVAKHSYFAGISIAFNCIEIITYVLFVNGRFFAKIGLLKDRDINSLLFAGASCFNIIFMGTCATILCVKTQYVPILFIYCAALDP